MLERLDLSAPDSRAGRALDVGLCTFAILALELALIRWSGGQIRIIAYFTNLILVAAFLGMGLGVVLGRRRPEIVHAALPAVALFAALLAFAERLGLMRMQFPDPTMFLWGAEKNPASLWGFLAVTLFMVALFWMVAAIFVFVAAPLGRLFDQLPPLRAYSADIAGSLAGIVAVTGVSALGASPWEWLALGILPVLWFSRRRLSLASAVAAVVLAYVSGIGAFFSPYNRIDIVPGADRVVTGDPLRRDWMLHVNRDYHQRILDLSNARVDREIGATGSWNPLGQAVYEAPFRFRPGGRSALVVGAGTGNDVAAGLRVGYQNITAVEIDPTILELGRMLHPEEPYSDPRTRIVNDDARAYFERRPNDRFDVVAYGLLDSHAMFSAMSTLRLDNYVYTVEGIRAGWEHVAPGGLLAISFSTYAGPWIEQRFVKTIREATGRTPVLIRHGMNYGALFIVGPPVDSAAMPVFLRNGYVAAPEINASIRMPTDDWPFLYLRPGTVPVGYLTVLFFIAVTAVLAIRRVFFAADAGAGASSGARLDWPMFLMGAGFMLLETRMVTELSLLFGSTWIVNACVFGGVLVMVLLANLWVSKRPPSTLGKWYLPLLASLVVTWVIGAGTLNALPIAARGLVGGVLFALPVGFAGIIVATLLVRAPSLAAALGSNLLGSVLGGILEYSSMFLGLRFVAILAFVCYVGAFLALRRAPQMAPAAQPVPS